MKAKTRKTLFIHLIILLGLAVYIAALITLRIYCPFRYITSIPCPGCGMFRALFALITGQISLSFMLHPLLIPTCMGLMLIFHAKVLKLPKWLVNTIAISLALALILLYVIRLIGGTIP